MQRVRLIVVHFLTGAFLALLAVGSLSAVALAAFDEGDCADVQIEGGADPILISCGCDLDETKDGGGVVIAANCDTLNACLNKGWTCVMKKHIDPQTQQWYATSCQCKPVA